MDYFFSEDQLMIRDLARQLATERIRPVAAHLDETEQFPHEIIKALAASDMFALPIAEEYGGMGMGTTELCLVMEEISRACAGVAVTYAASFLGALPLMFYGSDEQKKEYLPRVVEGEITAFGLTEAEAGSDAGRIRTTAERVRDHYVLNGSKQWITNGGEASIYTIIALTDKDRGARGASAFVVEKGTPGFEFGKQEKKMGIRCSATRELVFQDCTIPAANMIGRRGAGFMIAMKTLDRARPGVAAQAIGIAQEALDLSVEYARTRKQFDRPIFSFQAIQHMLADMATGVESARALLYATTRMIDAGSNDFSKESAMCKLYASDVAMKATTDAVQIFGGYGYMRDYPVEKLMRDAKITQIYEGTNQIQRNVIASALAKEATRKHSRR